MKHLYLFSILLASFTCLLFGDTYEVHKVPKDDEGLFVYPLKKGLETRYKEKTVREYNPLKDMGRGGYENKTKQESYQVEVEKRGRLIYIEGLKESLQGLGYRLAKGDKIMVSAKDTGDEFYDEDNPHKLGTKIYEYVSSFRVISAANKPILVVIPVSVFQVIDNYDLGVLAVPLNTQNKTIYLSNAQVVVPDIAEGTRLRVGAIRDGTFTYTDLNGVSRTVEKWICKEKK